MDEYDMVVLTSDLPEHGLAKGDAGVILIVHADGGAFEVEFVSPRGETIALLTLTAEQVRPSPTAK